MSVGSVVIQREDDGRRKGRRVDSVDIAAPFPFKAGEQDTPESHLAEHCEPEPRTTASESQSCEHRRRLLTGERFCSDRCRMRDLRHREQSRLAELLQQLECDLDALRDELVGEVEP